MPLSESGKKIISSFKSQYGKKGEGYFYGYLNKHPAIKAKVEGKKDHASK